MTITQRIDAITRIPESYRKEILPAPRSVKIELTARCNFSCAFCARSDELRVQQDMDQRVYRNIVSDLSSAGVEELGVFYLGESMLVKWLDDAIRYAKQVGIEYVFLTTNGSAATPRRLNSIFRAGLDSLKFSLNWSDRDQFAEIARSDPKLFDLAIKNIRAARDVRDMVERETGHHCGLYASYIEYDGLQRERMQQIVKRVAPLLDEVYALPLYSQAGLVDDAERERGWKPTPGNRGRVGALREPLPCWSVFMEGHVTWDGKLSVCCFDHDGRFVVGDLTKQNFMTAWNCDAFQKLRRSHLSGSVKETVCERCAAVYS